LGRLSASVYETYAIVLPLMPEKLLDTLHTGLVTSEELEAKPYGFRVTWIKWDSGFRGTDLQIGDRIVGMDDESHLVANGLPVSTRLFSDESMSGQPSTDPP
jgi:hypothetical protein